VLSSIGLILYPVLSPLPWWSRYFLEDNKSGNDSRNGPKLYLQWLNALLLSRF